MHVLSRWLLVIGTLGLVFPGCAILVVPAPEAQLDPLYQEALTMLDSPYLAASLGTDATIDLNALAADTTDFPGETMNGNFAVSDRDVGDLQYKGASQSDADVPDDGWPAGITIRFVVAATGELFVGASGADNDLLTLLANRDNVAWDFYPYNNRTLTDPDLIWGHWREFDHRANSLAKRLSDKYFERLISLGYANGEISDSFFVNGS